MTQNVLNFFKFSGTNLGGEGGQALVQKWGQVSDGGLTIFCQMGGPPSPQEKKPLKSDLTRDLKLSGEFLFLCLFVCLFFFACMNLFKLFLLLILRCF